MKIRLFEKILHYDRALAEIDAAIAQIKKAKYENEEERSREIQGLQ
ncbi:MAG: hypothetical protein AAGG75_25785 [Bacteroidota bacterium]